MKHPLSDSSRFEAQLADQIRAACEQEIARRELSHEDLAAIFRLLPLGVDILLARRWTLDKAIRVADGLGLTLRLSIESEGGAISEQALVIGSLSRPSGLAERVA